MQIPESLLSLIQGGENETVEFSASRTEASHNLGRTICAFANREGGHLFLGIQADGAVSGIREDRVEAVRQAVMALTREGGGLYPPLWLTPVRLEIDGRTVLCLQVPAAPEVARWRDRIMIRNGSSNLDITDHFEQVFQLYSRKVGIFTANQVTGHGLEVLRPDLIDRARSMTPDPNHPWRSMPDDQLLRSAGLLLPDEVSRRSGTPWEGITVAGILLFGRDSAIRSALPQYRTEAICRRDGVEVERETVATNLLESHDRLMAFGRKHLDSGTVGERILRELVSNLLTHREYLSGFPARLVLEDGRIRTENASLARRPITLPPRSLEPVLKNPPIGRVFREIGWGDELGAGLRNVSRWARGLSGAEPAFSDGPVFLVSVPLAGRS